MQPTRGMMAHDTPRTASSSPIPGKSARSPLVLLAVDDPVVRSTVELALSIAKAPYRSTEQPAEIVRLLTRREVDVGVVCLRLLRPVFEQCEPASLLHLWRNASLLLIAGSAEEASRAGVETGGSVLHIFFGTPVLCQLSGLLAVALHRAVAGANVFRAHASDRCLLPPQGTRR